MFSSSIPRYSFLFIINFVFIILISMTDIIRLDFNMGTFDYVLCATCTLRLNSHETAIRATALRTLIILMIYFGTARFQYDSGLSACCSVPQPLLYERH